MWHRKKSDDKKKRDSVSLDGSAIVIKDLHKYSLVLNLTQGNITDEMLHEAKVNLSETALCDQAVSTICTLVSSNPLLQTINLTKAQMSSSAYKTLILTYCLRKEPLELILNQQDFELDLTPIDISNAMAKKLIDLLLNGFITKIKFGADKTINLVYLKLITAIIEKQEHIDFTGCHISTETELDEIKPVAAKVIKARGIKTIKNGMITRAVDETSLQSIVEQKRLARTLAVIDETSKRKTVRIDFTSPGYQGFFSFPTYQPGKEITQQMPKAVCA